MMQTIGSLCFVILMSLATTTAVYGQDVFGSLAGRVLSDTGYPAEGVAISVRGDALQGVRGGYSTPGGQFWVSSLPVGTYVVRIEHAAYQSVTYSDVAIRLGRTTGLGETRLTPRTLEMDTIIVSGQRPLIDPSSTTLGGSLSASTFKALPVQRDYASMAVLLPHANDGSHPDDGVNISGNTGWNNLYYVDGVHVTDPRDGNTGSSLPSNFIRELEVKTGGYQAEFGRSVGGIVNAVTHSGSNDMKAQVFGYFTNAGLTAAPAVDAAGTSAQVGTDYDVGFTLGGPLVKDRAWFYIGYNPRIQSQDVETQFVGSVKLRTVTHRVAGKLTWQAATNTNVVLTAIGDPTNLEHLEPTFGGLPEPTQILDEEVILGRRQLGGFSLSGRAHHQATPSLYLEATLSRLNRRFERGARDDSGFDAPLFADLTTGIWSGGYGQLLSLDRYRTAADFASTYTRNSHLIKAGLQYEHNSTDHLVRFRSGRDLTGLGLVMRTGENSYIAQAGSWGPGTAGNKVYSAFIQDSWTVSESLRANLGFRWDMQRLYGPDGVVQSIADQYQPRLGLVYLTERTDPQRFFGSWGRFYNQVLVQAPATYIVSEELLTLVYSDNPINNPSARPDTVGRGFGVQGKVEGMGGEYIDEFTLGYERAIGPDTKLGVKGIYRDLKQGIDGTLDRLTGLGTWGNPGKGELSILPEAKRTYKAVEISVERTAERIQASATYVLSRSSGNFGGNFHTDGGFGSPNFVSMWALRPENQTGPLPSDRTHVFKLFGTYKTRFGLAAGTFFRLQQGTPVSETSLGLYFSNPLYVSPRGSEGRTPVQWNWDLRLTYDLAMRNTSSLRPRLVLDMYNLFSRKKPVLLDQVRYLALDADDNPVNENPSFLTPKAYQPSMSTRLGIEMDF